MIYRTPGHYLAYLAAANPLNLDIMGENTSSNNTAAMERSIERMREYNMKGLMWAFEPQLLESGSRYAALAQYSELIQKASRGE